MLLHTVIELLAYCLCASSDDRTVFPRNSTNRSETYSHAAKNSLETDAKNLSGCNLHSRTSQPGMLSIIGRRDSLANVVSTDRVEFGSGRAKHEPIRLTGMLVRALDGVSSLDETQQDVFLHDAGGVALSVAPGGFAPEHCHAAIGAYEERNVRRVHGVTGTHHQTALCVGVSPHDLFELEGRGDVARLQGVEEAEAVGSSLVCVHQKRQMQCYKI